MKKETLKFGEGVVEVYLLDTFIYFKILNLFDDEIAIAMTRYIDKIIGEIPDNLIRIWDHSTLPSKAYRLTSECVQKVVDWSQGIKIKKPGSKAYFVSSGPLVFGVSRMYELQSSDENMDVIVLKSIDELPQEIRDKIPV